MKKTLCFGLSAMIAVLISSCGEYHVDYECEVGDSRCEDDVIYKCVQAKDGSTTYWEKSKCDGVCKNNKCEECDINKPNWCEVNGDGKSMAYTCNKICKNNEESCSEDDKIVRKETFLCVNNKCDLDKKKCDCSNCVNECEADGSCKKVDGCDLHDERGACVCKNGTTDKGACKNICIDKNGFDETDGSCACNGCKNGCNPDGSCVCPGNCVNGCDRDGSCVCKPGKCLNGCDENGACTCPDDCKAGCFENGLCRVIGSCLEENDCNQYAYCEGNQCYCDKTQHMCMLNDQNGNHMYDYLEEGVDNKDCWKNEDCTGAVSTGEKFCDNAMGYKCSIKCNKDDQCVDGFICRNSDGRCVSEYFTTVWDKSIRSKSDFSFTVSDCPNGIEVCWDWKDGKCGDLEPIDKDKCSSGKLTHDYTVKSSNDDTNADVVIKIKGELNGVNFYKLCANYNTSEAVKYCKYDEKDVPCCELLEVQSFGLVGFSNAKNGVFEQCYKLRKVSEIDIPDPGKLKGKIMERMFIDACSFDSSIENWDVSNVTSLEKLFWGMNCRKPWSTEPDGKFGYCFDIIPKFNQPLNHWNVSKVKNMNNVFSALILFNQPLDNWDVSHVEKMDGMFGQCSGFNQNIGMWDVSNVTTMEQMFLSCSLFDQDLSGWDVSNVTNMNHVFELCDDISVKNYCAIYKSWKNKNKNINPFLMGPYVYTYTWNGNEWVATPAGSKFTCQY
ncbi:MAG: BspA family leucine-rich repeat surface protein [Proteobacteria bacterium]|nr:BspA family leucine-rich repeat surface protein [Pseudomonadota bacterium]